MKKLNKAILVICIISMMSMLFGCQNNNNENNVNNNESSKNNQKEDNKNEKQNDSNDSNDVNENEEVATTVGNMNIEGLPIVNEKVTYTFVGQKRFSVTKEYNDMELIKDLENETNVHIEWDLGAADTYSEKVNLMFASNTLPDAFFGASSMADIDYIKYSNEGIFEPLNDYVDKYAPFIKAFFERKPNYLSAISMSDGNYYAVPNCDEREFRSIYETLFINKVWLDNLGLEVPTTTEELKDVLNAFVNDDPNGNGEKDEIGYTGLAGHGIFGLNSLFGSFGIIEGPWANFLYTKDDGETVVTFEQEEYRDGLEYFHELYENGLIDPELFTQSKNAYVAKCGAGKVGLMKTFVKDHTMSDKNIQDQYISIDPMIGPEGYQLWEQTDLGVHSLAGFVISSEAENPEILVRWIDHAVSGDNSAQMYQGYLGERVLESDSDEARFIMNTTPPSDDMGDEEWRHLNSPGVNGVFICEAGTFALSAKDQEKSSYREQYIEYVPMNKVLKHYLSTEEIEELDYITQPLLDYAKEMKAEFIVNGVSNQDWEDYLEQLKILEVDKYLDIHTESIKRIQ